MFISMGSTSKYHMKWKLVCVCKCGSRIFFQGTIVFARGFGFFFRYTCIYYKNLILNFPWARGSGPLGIFKLFIRSAHGIYLFVCNFMLSVIVCISFGSLPHAVKKTNNNNKKPSKISSYKDGWSKLYYIKYINVYHLHHEFKFHQTKTYILNLATSSIWWIFND